MGSDLLDDSLMKQLQDFNPRSPDGERPEGKQAPLKTLEISIHAPRMGSDHNIFSPLSVKAYFNPRSPDGERLFQPVLEDDGTDISIHAPRMGSDLGFSLFIQWSKDFNPRSPDGERPEIVRRLLETVFISIHAPRMGSDRENGHLRPRYGQNHPFSTLIVSQIVVDVLGTVRKSQKHQRTSHYEVIKQPERQK